MAIQNVNTLKLQQAIKKYGSLQVAMEALEDRKETLETEISALDNKLKLLKKNEERSFNNIKQIEKTFKEREQELHELEDAFGKYKQDIEKFVAENKQFMLQHLMVESLVAMLTTSPTEKETIKELAISIQIIGEAVWNFSQPPAKLRKVFIYTVLGNYLYCYCCDRCGLKFIANQEVKSHILGYYCPNCGSLSSMRADDTFLDAMLNANEPPNTNERQEHGK